MHLQAMKLSSIQWTDSSFKSCVLELAKRHGLDDSLQFSELKCHSANIRSPVAITHFEQLQHLSLYNNDIIELDLRNLGKLRVLNVASNQLKTLLINDLGNLNELYAFRNKLATINFQGLVKLTKMRLMQNELVKLDITPLKALREAHIFDNKLKTLSLEGLMYLQFLDVRQNPMPDELYDEFDAMAGITISHDGNADDWK